ncbi:chloride channel protein, partial [Oleiagrimonas sp. MCCC 1A03011]|uniref:chloride channel protein n=1 Tax=Oleiagrimonas sp. MCCC 1A03011 TaxID=1926883 RepID=UPI000DC32C58
SAPVSAVLLAVELLLFERRARSLIPVALATVTATGMRYMLMGTAPVFPMPDVALATLPALGMYTVFGVLVGLVSIGVTRATYAVEDTFEKLPVHWMWWPAIGGVAVGVIGYLMPSTLGVGYDNITAIISGHLGLGALALLCVANPRRFRRSCLPSNCFFSNDAPAPSSRWHWPRSPPRACATC